MEELERDRPEQVEYAHHGLPQDTEFTESLGFAKREKEKEARKKKREENEKQLEEEGW